MSEIAEKAAREINESCHELFGAGGVPSVDRISAIVERAIAESQAAQFTGKDGHKSVGGDYGDSQADGARSDSTSGIGRVRDGRDDGSFDGEGVQRPMPSAEKIERSEIESGEKVELGDGEPSPPPCRNAGDSESLAEISELVLGYREGRNTDIVSRVKHLTTLEVPPTSEIIDRMGQEAMADATKRHFPTVTLRSGAAQEVSPPSPEPDAFKAAWAEYSKGGHGALGWEKIAFTHGFGEGLKAGEAAVERLQWQRQGEFKRAEKAEGDTRELKAALQEMFEYPTIWSKFPESVIRRLSDALHD